MKKTRTDQFRVWLVTARPGSTYIYHRGLLCFDREPKFYEGEPSTIEEEVNEVADAAWAAYKDGLVHLTKRRLGKNVFEYIATKADKRPRRLVL